MKKNILTLLFSIAFYCTTIAQTFELRLVNQNLGSIGVQMRTTSGTPPTTTNVLTDLVFGICWDNTYNVNLTTITTTYDIEKAGSEAVSGGTRYQLFAKSANPLAFPQNWVLNTWVTVISIPNSRTSSVQMGTFSVCPLNIQELNTNYDLKDYSMTAAGNATNVQINAAVLPVELTQFTASATLAKDVLLNWTTHQEVNLAYYEVEHSMTGSDFSTINKTNAIKAPQYSYLHQQPKEGTQYYRLKIVDKDGAFKYSNTISLDIKKNDIDVVIFPNPVSKGNTVLIKTTVNDVFELSIFSVDGKKVLSGKYDKEAPISTKGWHSGLYIYEITTKSGVHKKGSFSVT